MIPRPALRASMLPALGLLLTGSAAASGDPVRLLRSDATEVRLEVVAPAPVPGPEADGFATWEIVDQAFRAGDWGRVLEPGAPDLPFASFLLGIPPGTRPVLQVEAEDAVLLPGPAPRPVPRSEILVGEDGLPVQIAHPAREEKAWSAPYPRVPAELGEPGTLRHLDVVPVRVYPYRWDPAAGAIRFARRLAISVRFVPDEQKAVAAARLAAPGAEPAGWERIYRQSVLNADQALAWRRTPAHWRATTGAAARRSAAEGGEFRIPVTRSDLYRVSYERLAAAGWDAPGAPIYGLALVERFFDETRLDDPFVEQPVPILARDLNRDGAFGPGDDFLFIGLNAWDRLHPPARDRRYGREHAYFLSLRAEGGLRFPERESHLGQTGLPVETAGNWSQRFEEEAILMIPGVDGTDGDQPYAPELGVEAIRQDHYLWFGGDGGDENNASYRTRFTLPGMTEVTGLTVALQRFRQPSGAATAHVTLSSGPTDGAPVALPGMPLLISYRNRHVYRATGADLLQGGVTVVPGSNTFRMAMPIDQAAAALDWLEWSYRRDLLAEDRRLAFRTGALTGAREFHLLNFGTADTTGADRLLLFDLSDSARTTTEEGPLLLTWQPSQYQEGVLKVQVDFGPTPREETLLAVSPARAREPESIRRVGEDDLTIPPGADEDLIAILHPDFAMGIGPLLQQRRDQGLTVRPVLIGDVVDQFNGGRPGPVAIRNYLRYLFRARATSPSYLLLVGDASEDFGNHLTSSSVNFVPTQTIFSDAYSEQGPELVSCDYWFVDRLSELGERFDYAPDMHVGRLPVGTEAELTEVVRKIVRYAEFRPDDSWRARGLFVADDEFSSTIGFGGGYFFRGDQLNTPRRTNESRFRWTAWEGKKLIHEAAGFTDFEVDSFFTAVYMDTVAGSWSTNGNPVDLRRCRTNTADCPAYRCPIDPGQANYCLSTGDDIVYADFLYQNWWADNYDYGQLKVKPLLTDAWSRGYLFVSYQGHANSTLLSHEYIFRNSPRAGFEDALRVRNNERPFVFMGFGCHVADFAREDEETVGDSMGERMLFLEDRRGNIACLGSTAYEWIDRTEWLNLAVLRAWFEDPPRDEEGNPRWVLGEIISAGKARLTASDYTNDLNTTYNLIGDPSMPMEMAPPRLSLFVNCTPGDEGCEPWAGGRLEAEAESDTARIHLRLRDETGIRAIEIRDEVGLVDPSEYRFDADPEYPDDPTRRVLVYARPLTVPEEDYTIEITARDGNGQTRAVSLSVELAAVFRVRSGGVLRPVQPDVVIEPGDSVFVEAISPVDLEASDLELWLDDEPLLRGGEPSAGGFRAWELRSVMTELSEGTHRLRLLVRRPDHSFAERAASFQGPGADRTDLLHVYNFPNPFTGETRVIYRLNRSGVAAKVSVFTLAGRRIWSADGPALANDNEIAWDGRDADGDPVANGVYLYKLEIQTSEGKKISRVERMARAR